MNEKTSDTQLFRELIGDVSPLKDPARVPLANTPEKTPGLKERRRAAARELSGDVNPLASEEFVDLVHPRDILAFKRDGVQHGVYKKLRLGKYAIDSRIDLHRMTVSQARMAILTFIRDCLANDIRCCLVTHGRGEGRDKPALLKSCVNHWLRQMPEVLAYHSAQPQHGGSGATYVLLRKSDAKREENKEKFSKRQR